jgi:DNA-binding XRE family transcriptional regulator
MTRQTIAATRRAVPPSLEAAFRIAHVFSATLDQASSGWSAGG